MKYLAIPAFLLGLILAIAPQIYLPNCDKPKDASAHHKMDMAHGATTMNMYGEAQPETHAETALKKACYWTARAELGVGIVIALLSVTAFFGETKFKLGVWLGILANALLATAIPNWLIGVCQTATMGCRMITLPALTIIGGITAALAVVAIIFASRKKGN